MAVGSGVTLSPGYCEDITYPAYQDRLLIKSLGVQAGVVETEDFKVSAGTGLQVNVKKGKAFVEQTKAIEESSNAFYNGLYNVQNPIEQNPYNNVEVSAVNPQIAQIILRVYDVGELKSGGGNSFARLEWLNGSPNALATEAKMKEGIYEGRAELAQSSLRLANVLVPKNATKSSEFFIQDSRILSNSLFKYKITSQSYQAKGGEFIETTFEPSTVNLPFPSAGATIGIYCSSTASPTIISSKENGGEIFGDFISGGKEITLLTNQHVILIGNSVNWRIIAGEPKRENKYTALTERAEKTEFEPSSSRITNVILTVEKTEEGSTGSGVQIEVEGVVITNVPTTGTFNTSRINLPISFLINPGGKWKWIKLGSGGIKVFSSYKTL